MKKIFLYVVYLLLPFAFGKVMVVLETMMNKKTEQLDISLATKELGLGIYILFGILLVLIILVNNSIIRNFYYGKLWGIIGALPCLIIYQFMLLMNNFGISNDIINLIIEKSMLVSEFITRKSILPIYLVFIVFLIYNNIVFREKEE